MTPTLIKAWRWVMQPKVWRFVGFASAVVGLLCYSLSSSFNYLFGKWNLLKIVLYSVFSFIISLMILFAKLLQHSASLRFKTHTAFLVLAVTSAYSFFFDKVVNGKPDIYSLISCGAFAIMSLSLSTQTQFGFEFDLLYFFLGSLIVQLMKIKLQLFFVGVAFGYSLVILRSSISSIDSGANNSYFDLQDGNSVVLSMDSLQLTSADIASASDSNGIDSPQLVITTSISRMMEQLQTYVNALQHENSNFIEMLLEHVKKYVEENSELGVTDPNYLMDAMKSETIKGLEETAKVMMSAGFEKDFSDVYINCRRKCLNECLMHRFFGLHELSVEDVHNMPWKSLEAEIEKWIKAFNVTLKILLPGERRLCERIFFEFSTTADSSFVEISRGSTVQLLNFANSIATGSRSPERLFKMIEMFKTLRGLIPDFDSVFSDEYSVSLRNEADIIWKRLGEAIRDIFIQLEELYRQEHRNLNTLESNLNAKSKFYDGSFSCEIFLINNDTYMIPNEKSAGLEILVWNNWFRRYALKVLHYDGQHNMGTIPPELAHQMNVIDSEVLKGNKIELQEKEVWPWYLEYLGVRSNMHVKEIRTLVIPHAPQFGSTDEMPPENILTWRKYATKEIFDFKYPRNYYRCCNDKDCQTMMQVQQLSDNPNVFEVLYYIDRRSVTPASPSYEWLSSGTPGKSINSIPEAKEAAPADGGHHPMLENVLDHLVIGIRSQPIKDVHGDQEFSFSAETEGVMKQLESILASKSEKYVDTSLRHLFMMNNWRYLELANKRGKLDEIFYEAIFNDVWVQVSKGKVLQYLQHYQRNSCDKVLEFLKLDINDSMEINVSVDLMKEKLSLFNMHFSETCRVQCSWSVHDEELRGEIIESLKNILLPAYGIFIGKFQDIVKNNAYEYIEYGMFDIHDVLDHLFLGTKNIDE